MTVKDWIHLIAFSAATGGAGYLAVKPYYKRYFGKGEDSAVNLTVSKEKDKVVDFVEIEDLGEKTSFCRCWRSKKVSCKYVCFYFSFYEVSLKSSGTLLNV